jgi:metallophosphoesterase (TIGR03767 family)
MRTHVSRRTFLKQTAALTAARYVGVPELSWREAWASTAPGNTTLSRTIVGTGGTYQRLAYGPGEPYLLRQDLGVTAQTGRAERRVPLLYFAQLSDTHILDAQSPARVEFLDPIQITSLAFRPQEMLTPFVLDSMVRRINSLLTSELTGASLAFLINTGDVTDNRQYNELRWVIDLLDGGSVLPRSGGPSYEGVQKGNSIYYYYHPDQPLIDSYGRFRNFPAYPGLLESAELPFSAAGVRVPWYAVYGNHDGLVQGNLPALRAFEKAAVGRTKIIGFPFGLDARTQFTRDMLRGDPTPWRLLLNWAETQQPGDTVAIVTPDPNRRLLSRQEWIKEHFTTRGLPVGHGFSTRNADADTAYYTFDPNPRFHCVVLDTVNPSGGANGCIDQKQFNWLDADLSAHAATLTLVFAHHSIGTMDNVAARENNPVLSGTDLEKLLWRHPNVVAFVNGHSHANTVVPHANASVPGTGFWEINTAAHIDFPEQSRLIEIFDNGDRTLSIFATIVDHLADPDTPSLTPLGLATISRELAFNDPQLSPSFGLGTPLDRNVELILARPSLST